MPQRDAQRNEDINYLSLVSETNKLTANVKTREPEQRRKNYAEKTWIQGQDYIEAE